MRKENRLLVLEDVIFEEKRRLTTIFPKTFVKKVKKIVLRCTKVCDDVEALNLNEEATEAIIRDVRIYLNTNHANPFIEFNDSRLHKLKELDEKIKAAQIDRETFTHFLQTKYNKNADTKRRQIVKANLTKLLRRLKGYRLFDIDC